jgi:FkbM family methyltransferase
VSVVALIDRAPAALAGRLRAGTRSARLLAPIVNRLLPSGETVVTVRSGAAAGLRIPIHPRREKFYWTGAYESEMQAALGGLLRPGMSFWDVGAHAGFMTLLGSRLVGKLGSVHAFEPSAPNRERLNASIRANDAGNVAVHCVAVTQTSGTVTLHRHGSTSMWTTVAELGDSPAAEVPSSTLDELSAWLGIPDVIKIDVEGAEADVLRGASRLLDSGLPKFLIELDAGTLEDARQVAPEHEFHQLGERHWLITRGTR